VTILNNEIPGPRIRATIAPPVERSFLSTITTAEIIPIHSAET